MLAANMRRLAIAIILAGSFSCVKKIPVSGSSQAVGGLSLRLGFLKDKGAKFDAKVNFHNNGHDFIVIKTDDVHCSRGSSSGRITNGLFANKGNTLALAAGDTREFLIFCQLNGSGGGDFRISVDTVYSRDAETGEPAEVLAKDAGIAVAASGQVRAPGESTPPARTASNDKPDAVQGALSSITDMFVTKQGSAVQGKSTSVSGGGSSSPVITQTPTPKAAGPAVSPTTSSPPPRSAPPPKKASPPPPKAAPPPPPAVAARRPRPPAAAHPNWIVAVMEVEDVNASSRKRRIDPNLIRNIGDQLRIFVAERGLRTVDRSTQESTLKETIGQMKADSYKSCYDDNCQVELGKALAATHILRTKITRFGSRCVLNGELIDLKAEVATNAASSRGGCGAEGFLNMSEDVAVALTAK